MIVLSNVSKCYSTQAGEVKALHNVSLSLPERGLVFGQERQREDDAFGPFGRAFRADGGQHLLW